MRLWKVFVLLAGVAGVIGFFTPLVEYRSNDGKLTNDASAFEVVRGVDQSSSGDLFKQAEKLGLSHEDAQKFARAFNQGMEAYGGMLALYYAPAALLLLLGVWLVVRDRMGRFAGLLALVLGGACCAVFAVFWQADQQSHDAHARLGLGLYLLAGCGVGAFIAGFGALISPDRGRDWV